MTLKSSCMLLQFYLKPVNCSVPSGVKLTTRLINETYFSKFCTRVELSAKSLSLDHEEKIISKFIKYQDTSLEFRHGRKYAAEKLKELFNISSTSAIDIATKFKRLQLTTTKTIGDNYVLLIREGVPNEIILKYADVLCHRDLETKINFVKALPYNFKDVVPLLNFETKAYEDLIKRASRDYLYHRLDHLSNLFRLPVIEICDILTKRRFLCKIDLARVERNYKLLVDYGISREEIQKDFWVLQYGSESIKRRLETAKELKADKIKTWMVRAQQEVFNRYIQRRYDNKLILGDNSIAEYLVNKLKCTMDQSKLILNKHPALLSKSVKKIDSTIDFIIEQGFTSLHIVRNPKILLHGFETTKKRLIEIKDSGINIDSLHILTKSQKQYALFYDSLLKNKIKEEM